MENKQLRILEKLIRDNPYTTSQLFDMKKEINNLLVNQEKVDIVAKLGGMRVSLYDQKIKGIDFENNQINVQLNEGNIRQLIEKGKVYLEKNDICSTYVFEIHSPHDSLLKIYIK